MKMVITKQQQIRSTAIGHQRSCCGTGIHRNWKKQPKGGRNAANRKACGEY